VEKIQPAKWELLKDHINRNVRKDDPGYELLWDITEYLKSVETKEMPIPCVPLQVDRVYNKFIDDEILPERTREFLQELINKGAKIISVSKTPLDRISLSSRFEVFYCSSIGVIE